MRQVSYVINVARDVDTLMTQPYGMRVGKQRLANMMDALLIIKVIVSDQ